MWIVVILFGKIDLIDNSVLDSFLCVMGVVYVHLEIHFYFVNWRNYCRYPNIDAADTIIFLGIPRIIRNTTLHGKCAKIENNPC